MKHFKLILLLTLLTWAASCQITSAAIRTWTGAGANPLWSNPTNWAGNLVPVTGDDLVFPPAVSSLVASNDFAPGFRVANVTLGAGGYQILSTNAVVFTGKILATNTTGAIDWHPRLISGQSAPQLTNRAGGTLIFHGAMLFTNGLAVGPLYVDAAGAMEFRGGVDCFEINKQASGTLRLLAANTCYVAVYGGALQMGHPSAVGPGAYVRIFNGSTLQLTNSITVTNELLLYANGGLEGLGTGTNEWRGPISAFSTNRFGADTGVLLVSGQISGNPAYLNKTLPGTVVLTATNSMVGNSSVSAGRLVVNGELTYPITVLPGATLSGTGRVSTVTVQAGGILAPGGDVPGRLATLDLNLLPGAILETRLASATPGTGFDQVSVQGLLSLTNAILSLNVLSNQPLGAAFMILTNDFAEATLGSFTNLTGGTIFTNSGEAYQISYTAGNGNDVVLTRVTGVPPTYPVIPLTDPSYTQDFNTLAQGGSANLWSNGYTLNGWYAQSGSGGNVTAYRGTNGNDTTGALYSFGATGSADRALGSLPSNATGPIGFGLCFTNPQALTLTNFTVSYTGEQWRSGGSGSVTNTLAFWYRTGASPIINAEPGTNTGWTAVPALNFTSPTVTATAGPLNGNDPTNRVIFTAVPIPGLFVAPGQTLFLRWVDPNDTGSDQGMAIDDLTVAYSGAVVAAPAQFSGGGLTNGFVRITGVGTPGASYQIQTATNIVPPVTWFPVGTVTADGAGNFFFTDEANPPTQPMRFYRAENL